MRNALVDTAKKEGVDESPQSIFAYLIDRVRANLHVVLCMSPVGEPFRYVLFYDIKLGKAGSTHYGKALLPSFFSPYSANFVFSYTLYFHYFQFLVSEDFKHIASCRTSVFYSSIQKMV